MTGEIGLQEYDSDLNFATNAWTLLNQKAMVAFTIHFMHKDVLMQLVLNVLEVPVM